MIWEIFHLVQRVNEYLCQIQSHFNVSKKIHSKRFLGPFKQNIRLNEESNISFQCTLFSLLF